MKELLTGNEAVARGAYEAGVTIGSAYPGTPSTEIFESLAQYEEIYCEWAPNEKVAAEVVVGASMAGARAISAMKHVGMNVASDPIYTHAYLGVNGGCVYVTADDPGLHSSQNEQDNRYVALHAKIPMLEPSDSQESKDMIVRAFEISEQYDVPIIFRMTTRVCHSKSIVEFGKRAEVGIKKYERNISKFVATPAACRRHHVELEEKLQRLEEFSNQTDLNFTLLNKDAKIGVITSGISYQYAQEVFSDSASYLKLGFTYPIPKQKIKDFSANYDTLYVVEENDPYLETQIKAMGINVLGKEKIPITGELNPEIIASSLLEKRPDYIQQDKDAVKGRPPTLCSGCPHRGLFFELSKRKDAVITGDIGCYTLGSADPLNAMDSVICMGAGVSAAHGFAKVFEQTFDERKVFGVVGDSTFFHSGITSLIDIVYNQSNCTIIILDNRVTGMTGHQENPGTGYTLKGNKAPIIEIEPLVRSIGIEDVHQVNPNNLKEVRAALNAASIFDGASVIITKWPCALKKMHEEEKKEYPMAQWVYRVDSEKCRKCRMCLKVGCPSISFDPDTGAYIDANTCVGCSVCAQVCPFDAIERVGDGR